MFSTILWARQCSAATNGTSSSHFKVSTSPNDPLELCLGLLPDGFTFTLTAAFILLILVSLLQGSRAYFFTRFMTPKQRASKGLGALLKMHFLLVLIGAFNLFNLAFFNGVFFVRNPVWVAAISVLVPCATIAWILLSLLLQWTWMTKYPLRPEMKINFERYRSILILLFAVFALSTSVAIALCPTLEQAHAVASLSSLTVAFLTVALGYLFSSSAYVMARNLRSVEGNKQGQQTQIVPPSSVLELCSGGDVAARVICVGYIVHASLWLKAAFSIVASFYILLFFTKEIAAKLLISTLALSWVIAMGVLSLYVHTVNKYRYLRDNPWVINQSEMSRSRANSQRSRAFSLSQHQGVSYSQQAHQSRTSSRKQMESDKDLLSSSMPRNSELPVRSNSSGSDLDISGKKKNPRQSKSWDIQSPITPKFGPSPTTPKFGSMATNNSSPYSDKDVSPSPFPPQYKGLFRTSKPSAGFASLPVLTEQRHSVENNTSTDDTTGHQTPDKTGHRVPPDKASVDTDVHNSLLKNLGISIKLSSDDDSPPLTAMSSIISTSTTPATKAAFSSLSAPTTKAANTSITATDTSTTTGTSPIPAAIDAATETTTSTTTAIPTATTTTTTTTTAALTSTTPTATSTTAIATTLAASANTANTDTPPRRSLTIPTSHITVHPASPIRTDSTPTPTPKSSSPTFKSTSLPRPPRSDTSSSSPTPISAIPPPLTRADTASSSPTAISAIPPHLSRAYTADDSSIPLSAIPPLFARAYLRNNDPSPTPTLASPSSYSHISYLPADSPSPTPSSPTLTISPPRALTRGPDPSASPPLDPAMPPSLARVYTDGHTDPAAISPQAVETMASNSMVISEVSVGSPPSSDIHSRRTSPFAVSPLPRPSPSHRLTTTNRTRESSMLSEIQEGDWSFSAVHTSEAGSSLPVSPARSRQSSSIADAMLNSKPSKSKQQPGMEVVANGDAEVIDGQVFPALHHEAPSPSLPTSTKATPMKVAVPAPASLVNDRSPYPHSSPLPFRSQHSPSQSSHLPSHLPDSLSLFPTSSSFTPKLSPYTSQKNSPAAVSHYLSSSLSSYPMPLQTTPSFEDVSVYPAFPPAISPSDHSHWDGPGQIMSQLDSTGQNRPSISAQVDSNTQQRDSITTNTHHLRPSISSPSPYPQHSPPSTTSFLGPMETNAHLGTNVSLYPLQLPHSPAAVASTSPQPSPPYPLPIPHSPTTALSTSPMYAQRSSYSQTTRSSSPGLGHGQPNPSTTNSSPGLTHLTPSHPARERKRKESKHSRQRSKDDWDVLSSAKPKPKPRLREKKHNRQRSRDDFSIDYDIAVQGVPQEDVNNMPAVSPDESRLSRSRSTSRIAHRSSLHEEKFPPPPPPPQPLTDPEAFMAAADVSGFLLPTPTHYVKSPRKVSTNSTVARIRSFGTPGQALRKLANRMTPGFSSRSIAKFGASSRATPRPAKASSRSTRNAIGSSSRARRQSGEEDHDSYPTIGTPQNGDSNGRLDPSGRGVGTPHMASTPHTYPSLLESMEMSEHPIAREKVPSLAMRDLPFTSLPQMHDALQTLSHTALRDMTSNVSNANSLARSYSAAPPSVNLGEPHMYARTSTTSTIGSFTTGLHMTAPNSPMHSQSPSPHVDAMRLSQSLPKSWGSQHGLEEIDLRKMAIADCQQEIAELSERIRTDPGGGYEMLGLQLVHLLQRQGGHERRLRELEQERQGGHERRLRELEQAEGQGGHERRLRELDQAEDKTPSSKTTTPSKATSSLAVPLPSSALRPQQPQRTVPPLTATPAKPLHVAVMAKHPALTTQQHLRRQPGSNEEFGEEQLGEDIDKDGGYTVSRTYPAARRALQMRNQQSVINTTRELQNRDMSVQIHVVSPRPSKRQLIPSPTRSQSASPQFAPQTSPLQLQSQTSPQLQPRASPLQLQSQTSPQLQPRARQEVVQRGRSATPPATADPVNPFSPGDRHVERLSIVAQNRGPTGEIPHYIEAFSPVASMNLASLGGLGRFPLFFANESARTGNNNNNNNNKTDNPQGLEVLPPNS